MIQNWADAVRASVTGAWTGFIEYVPRIIGAIIIFVIGLIVASVLGGIVERVLRWLRIDSWANHVHPKMQNWAATVKPSVILGKIVYWFVLIIFLLTASDALGLEALSSFLRDVILYIPNVIAAAIIVIVSMYIGNLLRSVIEGSVGQAAGRAAGALAWWGIVIFGFLAALVQLKIAPSVVNILVAGVVAMMALAGGLAFGLGGRDQAGEVIRDLRQRYKK